MNYDVLSVADFSPQQRLTFEWRALFLMASWAEFGGRSRKNPFHLVCIGDPPHSVSKLARTVGVQIHTALSFDADLSPTANKFRAFEVTPTADHFLLVDSDMLFLSEPTGLETYAGRIAACPAFMPRVSNAAWDRIYRVLGLPAPNVRMTSVAGALDLPMPAAVAAFPGAEQEMGRGMPYYNSGTIFGPWSSDLGGVWSDTMRNIRHAIPEADPDYRMLVRDDQVAFGIAAELLKTRGFETATLPGRFNTAVPNLYGREVRARDIHLFHCLGAFRESGAEPPPSWSPLRRFATFYTRQALMITKLDMQRKASRLRTASRTAAALTGIGHVSTMLVRLYMRHVRHAFQPGA